jgi:hypothetical protein
VRASVPSADIKAELDFLAHVGKQAIEVQRELWHSICERADAVLDPDEVPQRAPDEGSPLRKPVKAAGDRRAPGGF